MTRPGESDALEAAMQLFPPDRRESRIVRAEMQLVIATAYPHIFAAGVRAGREQAAQAIEALGEEWGELAGEDRLRRAVLREAADAARSVR